MGPTLLGVVLCYIGVTPAGDHNGMQAMDLRLLAGRPQQVTSAQHGMLDDNITAVNHHI